MMPARDFAEFRGRIAAAPRCAGEYMCKSECVYVRECVYVCVCTWSARVRDCTLTYDTAENQYPRPTDRPTDPPTIVRRRDTTRHLRRRRRLFARSRPPFSVAVALSAPTWSTRSGTNDQLAGTGCGQVKKQLCFPPRMSREAKYILNREF